MKTKKTVLTALLVTIGIVILSLSSFGYAIETHPNGWIYPAGIQSQGGYYGWKEKNYFNHVGTDYKLSPGDPVYSLANGGEIVNYSNALNYYGTACGGTGGAILVRYETMEHIIFYAVYGHCYIKEGLKIGSKVNARDVIGYIHDYYGKDKNGICNTAMHHLHFGIHPNTIDLSAPFRGVGTATDDFGWVNPTAFLKEHFPLSNGTVNLSYGTYIKFSNSSNVYLVFKNQLWWVKDEATFYAMGNNNFNNVIEYDSAHYAEITKNFPIAKTLVDENFIAKVPASSSPAKVYKFANGQWHWFKTWEIFTSYGFTDNDIVDITPEVFKMYSEGDSITSVSAFQGALISGPTPTTTPTNTAPVIDNGIVIVPSPEYTAKLNRNSTGTWYDRDGYVIDKNSYSQFSTLNGQAQIEWAESMGFSQDPTFVPSDSSKASL